MKTANSEGILKERLVQFKASYGATILECSLEENILQIVASYEDNKLERYSR